MGTIAFSQVYGNAPFGEKMPLVDSDTGLASQNDDIQDVVDNAKDDKSPALFILALIGGLFALRLVWEFAVEE